MARIRPSLITIKGKIGNKIIQGADGEQTIREAPKQGAKKHETALQRQNNRTAFLNKLSGELVDITNLYAKELKRNRLYQVIQKHFRREPLDNRFMLLKTLESFDIHDKYTLGKLTVPDIEIRQSKGSIEVVVRTLVHPSPGKYKADSFCYELVMITWNKTQAPPKHERIMTGFVSLKDKLPKYTFRFKIPSTTTHWLLLAGVQLGRGEEEIGFKETSAMRIMQAGTFDKKDMDLWENKMKELRNVPKKYDAKGHLPRIKPDEE